MKKLYNCSATCDERTLVSYNTRVVWADKGYGFIGIDYYPSSTTKSHIRKYIQWLREHKLDEYADVVRKLYDYVAIIKLSTRCSITQATRNVYKCWMQNSTRRTRDYSQVIRRYKNEILG